MIKISKYFFMGAVGGSIYYGFEIFFRGFSHWTMFLLGGICFLFFYIQGSMLHWKEKLWKQILRASIFVTSLEFIFGIVLNKVLLWNVWDYSHMPFQLFGQICLPFTIIFSGLCALGIILSAYLAHWFYKEEKPHFYLI